MHSNQMQVQLHMHMNTMQIPVQMHPSNASANAAFAFALANTSAFEHKPGLHAKTHPPKIKIKTREFQSFMLRTYLTCNVFHVLSNRCPELICRCCLCQSYIALHLTSS